MKIPKEIKIGGLMYKVQIVDHIKDSLAQARTHHDEQLIYIRRMKKTRIEQTLFHEIIHCINNELTEWETESIAVGIFQVLKDNKLI